MLNKQKTKWLTVITVTFVMLSSIAFAVTPFPQSVVSFDGIQVVKRADATTQGFVDITLKNVEATGISFCLEFDTEKLQLSNVTTNKPTYVQSGKFDVSHEYFEQDLSVFDSDVFINNVNHLDDDSLIPDKAIIGITDQRADNTVSHLRMNFLPQDGAEDFCQYIEATDDGVERKIMAGNQDLHLGRLSFNIIDPVEFAKLSPNQIKEAIKIVPFSTMSENLANTDNNTGIQITCLDTGDKDRVIKYRDSDRNIDYDFSIKLEIFDVQPQVEELTVSAADIYKQGTMDDLFDFINEKMSAMTLTYADDSQKPDIFHWDKTKASVSRYAWEPKGLENYDQEYYTITQPYYDSGFDVTVKVHVKPVKLIGFSMEDESKTYLFGADDFPTTFDGLLLPKKAKPIFDTYIKKNNLADVPVDWYSLDPSPNQVIALPDDFSDGSPHQYTYKCHFKTEDEQNLTNTPWLTTTSNKVFELLEAHPIYRNVVTNKDDLPNALEVVDASTDEDGYLTITVQNKEKEDGTRPPIPANTVFDIKMPGGELIDTDSLASNNKYTITYNPDGTATILIKPDINSLNENERRLAPRVNLGERAGSFSIASTEPGTGKNRGEFVDFTTEPRKNHYLGPLTGGNDYVFDFSGSLSGMFPVSAGTTLPTTITLIRPEDRIRTTYSGYDGTVEGYLQTFIIDDTTGWSLESGNPSLEDDVVTVKGKLKDTNYTNYGNVDNVNNVYVTIKYRVSKKEGSDSIDSIPDFIYNPRQQGYGYDVLQTQPFTVYNNGTTELHGLSAHISLSTGNNKEAFTVVKELPQILKSGESADLEIRNNIGLPVIDPDTNNHTDYVCTVSIFSEDSTNPLQTFKITFTVTKNPTYNIKITVPQSQQAFGKAQTVTGVTGAQVGEIVSIKATPETDCKFTGWNVISNNVTLLTLPTVPNSSFEMPSGDVEIEAQFEETMGAKLRATDLKVKDKNEKDQDLHKDDWSLINFDPATREYYVEVSNDTDEVYLWFKLRAEAENAALTLTHTYGYGAVTDPVATPIKDTSDEYYKSVAIPMEVAPDENILTLSMKAKDENNKDITRDYKIHIYRKIKQSDLMISNYGNSPYGLIMRDTTLSPTDKTDYKTEFENNGYQFINGKVPQNGQTDIIYTTEAWPSKLLNYDLNDYALFVLNSESFVDPGYSVITNSIGEILNESDITKSVTVTVLKEINNKDGSSDDFVYTEQEKIVLPSSGTISQLKDKRIRPDYYEIKYTFTDFDGKENSAIKPLIILYSLGDVNLIDGVNNEDINRIQNRFSKDLANSSNVILNGNNVYDTGGLLFKYRICDVNNDTNLNAIDANRIKAGNLTEFYKNLT